MKSIEAHRQLLNMGAQVFSTSDAATCLSISRGTASQLLARLAKSGHLMRLRHGVWAIAGEIDLLAAARYLVAPLPGYISLQSALYHHGMISQIPAVLYLASISRSRIYHTPLGTVSVHHITPDFFWGYELVTGSDIALATPEKALLDTLYLAPARSKLFRSLPELELPASFNINKARQMIKRIPAANRRAMVGRLFDEIACRQNF